MKRILPVLCLFSSLSFGQTVITSIADGAFYLPTTWDCTCIPADGDSVIINHTITMNYGIPYTMGQITINSGGKLTDGGVDQSIYINGGTLVNLGTLECKNLLLDSGYIYNSNSFTLDSLLTRDSTDNSGTIVVYDFLHDQNATFTNVGTITVTNNFNNEGVFDNVGTMTVANDFSNCNIQTSNATFQIDGTLSVANNFLNCDTDTLRGSGVVNVCGSSTNAGEMQGNFVMNTPSGTLGLNTGTVESGITFGTAVCDAGTVEQEDNWLIYPNPATSYIKSSLPNVYYTIYDYSGKVFCDSFSESGLIQLDQLATGIYAIRLIDRNGSVKTSVLKKD